MPSPNNTAPKYRTKFAEWCDLHGVVPSMDAVERYVAERLQPDIDNCVQERVKEFHKRLKREVEKATCDVPKTEVLLHQMLNKMSDDDKKILCVVLWKEMQQVVKAVWEAK